MGHPLERCYLALATFMGNFSSVNHDVCLQIVMSRLDILNALTQCQQQSLGKFQLFTKLPVSLNQDFVESMLSHAIGTFLINQFTQ